MDKNENSSLNLNFFHYDILDHKFAVVLLIDDRVDRIPDC